VTVPLQKNEKKITKTVDDERFYAIISIVYAARVVAMHNINPISRVA
jgi:hypothetical protein